MFTRYRGSTEECLTKEEFLYELQKETLGNLRHYLCTHLQPEKLLPFLQSKSCLSVEDCEQIRSVNTTNGQVNKMIDIIMKSGPGCLIKLVKAIKRCNKTQLFIAEKLESRYKRLMEKDFNKAKLEQISDANVPRQIQTPPPPYTEKRNSMDSSIGSNQKPFKSISMIEPSSNGRFDSPSSFMSPLSVPKTPVVGDWPSDQRQRCETAGTCATNMLLDDVTSFQSNEFKTYTEGQTCIDDQRIEISKLSLENPSRQVRHSSGIDLKRTPAAGSNHHSDHTVAESVMEQHRVHMHLLQRRSRHPDEHDSSLLPLTEVKQLRTETDQSRFGSTVGRVESSVSRLDDYGGYYRSPDDESFEVSGED